MILRGTRGDRVAFLATLLGTWLVPLDQAIYIGVGISVLLFLRRVRLLTIREMTISEKGRFREVDHEQEERGQQCSAHSCPQPDGPVIFCRLRRTPSPD